MRRFAGLRRANSALLTTAHLNRGMAIDTGAWSELDEAA